MGNGQSLGISCSRAADGWALLKGSGSASSFFGSFELDERLAEDDDEEPDRELEDDGIPGKAEDDEDEEEGRLEDEDADREADAGSRLELELEIDPLGLEDELDDPGREELDPDRELEEEDERDFSFSSGSSGALGTTDREDET